MKKILILFLIGGSLTATAQVDSTTTPTTNPTTPSTNMTTTPSTTTAPTTSTSTPTDNASVQPGQHDYYYYPSQNVYYDKASGNYWYKETPDATTWTETTTLPSTISLQSEQGYPIQYNGNDPWKNNTADLKKYKVKDNGVVKMKTKKNDQK